MAIRIPKGVSDGKYTHCMIVGIKSRGYPKMAIITKGTVQVVVPHLSSASKGVA